MVTFQYWLTEIHLENGRSHGESFICARAVEIFLNIDRHLSELTIN